MTRTSDPDVRVFCMITPGRAGPVDERSGRGRQRASIAACRCEPPFPVELARRPFTVAEALERQVSPRVLEGPRFRTPHRGVRVPVDLPASRLVDLVAASLALSSSEALSGWTAVELAGLPTPRGDRDPGRGRIFAKSASRTSPRIAGMTCTGGLDLRRVVRAKAGVDTAQLLSLLRSGQWGLRIEHPLDVWCDLAPTLPFGDAVALGDAVRRHWATWPEMCAAVEARRGRRGAVVLREVLAAVRWRVDSPMETEVRLLLVSAGLPRALCGFDHSEGRAYFGRVDLVWLEQRVVIEYDGDVHRTERGQWQWDKAKRRRLRDAGWTVIELVGEDVRDRPDEVIAEVRRALERRTAA